MHSDGRRWSVKLANSAMTERSDIYEGAGIGYTLAAAKERHFYRWVLDKDHRILLGVHSRYGLHTRAVTQFGDPLSEGFSHFVTSMTAPVASGWSGCRVGFAPTGKRRLITAHTLSRHSLRPKADFHGSLDIGRRRHRD
jgi:hypothetical protein